jgi:hypothetical protein
MAGEATKGNGHQVLILRADAVKSMIGQRADRLTEDTNRQLDRTGKQSHIRSHA